MQLTIVCPNCTQNSAKINITYVQELKKYIDSNYKTLILFKRECSDCTKIKDEFIQCIEEQDQKIKFYAKYRDRLIATNYKHCETYGYFEPYFCYTEMRHILKYNGVKIKNEDIQKLIKPGSIIELNKYEGLLLYYEIYIKNFSNNSLTIGKFSFFETPMDHEEIVYVVEGNTLTKPAIKINK